MDSLVERLAEGSHPVTVGGPDPTVEKLQQAIGRDYVHIKFTGTRGGTDLGVRLDREASKLDGGDFQARIGQIHLEGTLTLDYVPVRCVADLDLATLNGTGHLVILKPSTERVEN